MSFEDGWLAINLQMPSRVPHTEYSVESHWEVIKAVTGLDVGPFSPAVEQANASRALIKAWNFDFMWSTLIGGELFTRYKTDMGHAEYAAGGVDWRDTIYCPFKTSDEVLSFNFNNVYGECNRSEWKLKFEQHYQANCRSNPDAVNMTGIYVTLLSGFIDIFGWDMLLLAAGTDLVAFGELANRYANFILPYFEALSEAKVPVVMIHDDMVWSAGPIFSPKWYRQYVFPNYKRYFDPLRQAGKKIMFTSDGNYTEFIDDLARCGVNGFIMEPMTDMSYIAKHYGKTHVFIGNADTRILLDGNKTQIRAEVERCMAIGKSCPGFFMAVGNHIPSNTPVENVLYYMQVYEELSKR
jgi:uroporphyrinogen decarboxylase